MKIKVGSYVLNGNFKGKKNAKEVFLSHYPVVTESDLDQELDKLFKDGSNKSDNPTQPSAKSDDASTVVHKGGTGKEQSRKD